jgi:hypothetical protein
MSARVLCHSVTLWCNVRSCFHFQQCLWTLYLAYFLCDIRKVGVCMILYVRACMSVSSNASPMSSWHSFFLLGGPGFSYRPEGLPSWEAFCCISQSLRKAAPLQRSPWEASSLPTTPKLPYMLCNQRVRYHFHVSPSLVHVLLSQINPVYSTPSYNKQQTPWSESASELYPPSDRSLSAKWLPTFSDKGCHVVSVTDPYGRILGFPDRSRYFSIK